MSDYLFNLALNSARPVGWLFVVTVVTVAVLMCTEHVVKMERSKIFKVFAACVLALVVHVATRPSITPKNTIRGRIGAGVVSSPKKLEISDKTRKPELVTDKDFQEIVNYEQ